MSIRPTETDTLSTISRSTDTDTDAVGPNMYPYPCSSSSRGHVNYLDASDPKMITARDLVTPVDWCYGIVDHYRYSRETVASAMEMVVRFQFLSSPSNSADAARPRVFNEALSDQRKFQLLTVTALYISIKINEKVAISSDLFSEMCRHIYSAGEIEEAERLLLSGLSWRCHAPTAHQDREDKSPSGKDKENRKHHGRKLTSSRPRRKVICNESSPARGKEGEKSRRRSSSRSRHSKSKVPVPGPPPSRPWKKIYYC